MRPNTSSGAALEMPPLHREKRGFSDAAAAQELDCVSNYSRVVPIPMAKSKFMILW
jgi:hypothetical protein